MLLKLIVFIGLAIYFYRAGEPGLAFLAVAAIVPRVGLLVAALLVVALVVKTWYGSAAIIAALIAFNLLGNKILGLDREPPTPPRDG